MLLTYKKLLVDIQKITCGPTEPVDAAGIFKDCTRW